MYQDSQSEQTVSKEPLDLTELQEPDIDEVQDLERKTGDWSVYAYYFKVIGLLRFSVFVFFAALQAFTSSFSSMSTIICTRNFQADISLQVSGSSGGQT
jgi:hypothetical protein